MTQNGTFSFLGQIYKKNENMPIVVLKLKKKLVLALLSSFRRDNYFFVQSDSIIPRC